tara:strand:- start:956 stop:1777 length:822 start_codon:yes stop_codon:yes gene_type:complete
VKQDFSVSATTGYTLSQSVTSANDIALFINNVRQEPTFAYSASGTSLTLTAATASTDDMYCIYLGRAVGTINPASGSVGLAQLSATGTKNSSTFLRGDNSFAEAGGGKLLQVVNVHNNDYATYSNTNVDSKVQVFTASITPSATDSKILLTGFISMSSTNSSVQSYGIELLRGSTVIGTGDASSWNSGVGTAHSIVARGDNASYSKPDRAVPIHFLDTPSTTSATTYNFKGYANHFGSSLSNSTLVINGGGYSYNNKETGVPTSNITLMEIGA